MATNPDPQQFQACLTPEGVLRDIQINLLECKVCFEKFCTQQRGRRPQNLSCGHVLCLECIKTLSHPLLKMLECPFCRQLCSADSTSHCQALCDLQELLLSWRPESSAHPHKAKQSVSLAAGINSTGLSFSAAFGSWGTLINPTGIAILGSAGTIFVVHGGEKRVLVFNTRGRELNSFGPSGKSSEEVCYPVDVAVTLSGYVVVTDAGDKSVKIFTYRGKHVLTVKESFQMPWGVDTDCSEHILVSDTLAGTLSHVRVDVGLGVVVDHRVPVSELQHPKAVACCQASGNMAVIEHCSDDDHQPVTHHHHHHHHTRLKVFSKDFHLLYETDSFRLTMQSTLRLRMSSVVFDGGDLLVADSTEGMIWSLRRLQDDLLLTPLVGDRLTRPVGLVSFNDTLLVLDAGDHTVKFYCPESDVGSKHPSFKSS